MVHLRNDDREFKKPDVMYYLRQRTILVNLIMITVVWVTVTFNYYMINT